MASASEHLPPISTSPSPPPQTKPFRFKRKRKTSRSDDEPPRKRPSSPSPATTQQETRRSRRHHRRHHHSKTRNTYTPPTISTPPSPHQDPPLDPDIAFSESLFDALADDEGAQYWEGVYGQPIHTYSPYQPAASNDSPDHPNLERMTDDEYVAHVRSKMWEKSHQHIVEERAKREEERRKKKREREQGREGMGRRGEGCSRFGVFDQGIEDALRRGEERRKREREKRHGIIWGEYLKAWEGLRLDTGAGGGSGDGGKDASKHRIRWPVESGRWEDVGKEGIEQFLRHAPHGVSGTGGLGEVLKKERVRWHPDKMMQRAGEAGIDKEAMALVTEVFQIVDRLWEEVKAKK